MSFFHIILLAKRVRDIEERIRDIKGWSTASEVMRRELDELKRKNGALEQEVLELRVINDSTKEHYKQRLQYYKNQALLQAEYEDRFRALEGRQPASSLHLGKTPDRSARPMTAIVEEQVATTSQPPLSIQPIQRTEAMDTTPPVVAGAGGISDERENGQVAGGDKPLEGLHPAEEPADVEMEVVVDADENEQRLVRHSTPPADIPPITPTTFLPPIQEEREETLTPLPDSDGPSSPPQDMRTSIEPACHSPPPAFVATAGAATGPGIAGVVEVGVVGRKRKSASVVSGSGTRSSKRLKNL